MIKKINLPTIETDKLKGMTIRRVSKEFKPATQSLSIYNGNIFILFRGNNNILSNRVIDVYNTKTGKYKYSFSISNEKRRVYKFGISHNGKIYALEYDKNSHYFIFEYSLISLN